MTGPGVEARPAATVMLVRDAPRGGVEVLMLRRNAAAAFAAGMYVFPGGRVDDADAEPGAAAAVTGLDDAAASALLGLPAGGLAYWVAAIRECCEEAGVLLARTPDGHAVEVTVAERSALHDGELGLAELCRRHSATVDAGAMRYVAHWVTPVGETSRRFDTRFFLAAAPADQHGRHDGSETDDSRWVRPEDALAASERGELMLMQPTAAGLELLAGCGDVAEALARADAAGQPPRIQPRIRRDPDGRFTGLAMPGEPDYDELV